MVAYQLFISKFFCRKVPFTPIVKGFTLEISTDLTTDILSETGMIKELYIVSKFFLDKEKSKVF